jgi:hypothetical protein
MTPLDRSVFLRVGIIPIREIFDSPAEFVVIARAAKRSIFLLRILGKMDCFGGCAASQ